MSTLARLNIVVDTLDARRRLGALGVAGARAAQVIGDAFRRMSSRIGGVLRQLTSLKAAFASLGAALIIRNFIGVANTLEQVNFQLVAVTKSQDAANKILANTRTFATEVSFSFADMASASTRMAAQLKGDADKVDFFLRASADVAAVTGMSVQDATGQFMRMMAGGAAAADQFRERGVLAMMGFQAGAKYSLTQTEQLIKDAFTGNGSVLAGVAPSMATTFEGVASMIGDKVFELKAKLMDAGVFDFIKDAATVINTTLNENIEALGKNATRAGVVITSFLEDAVLFAGSAADGILNTKNAFLNMFDTIFANYNKFSTTSGGTVATFGILGFLVFGAKGGILGVVVSILYGVSDEILTWFSKTMGSIMQSAGEQLKSVGMNYNEGQYSGSLGQAMGDSGLTGSKGYDALRQSAYADRGGYLFGGEGTYDASSMSRDLEAGNFSETFLSILDAYMKKAGMRLNANGKSYTNTSYLNTTPIIGPSITRGVTGLQNAAANLSGPQTLERPKITDIITSALEMAGVDGGALSLATDGTRSTNDTAMSDAAQRFIALVRTNRASREKKAFDDNYNNEAFGSVYGAGGGPNTGNADTATAAAEPLAAHLLAQQYNAAMKQQIGILETTDMTMEQFNNKMEINKALIAAQIPLVGTLTAEQKLEADGIRSLITAQQAQDEMMKNLTESYTDYTSHFSEGWNKTVDAAANAAERTKEIGSNMYKSLEQGLSEFIKTGRLNMKSFLADMVTDYLAAQAKLAMANMFSSLFGSGGPMSMVGEAFSYGGQSAGGGPVLAGRAYTVGERGRETFVPNTGGRIVPNGGGGESIQIVQHFDFSQADEAVLGRLQQQAETIKAQTFSSVFDAIGQGGYYAKQTGRR